MRGGGGRGEGQKAEEEDDKRTGKRMTLEAKGREKRKEKLKFFSSHFNRKLIISMKITFS